MVRIPPRKPVRGKREPEKKSLHQPRDPGYAYRMAFGLRGNSQENLGNDDDEDITISDTKN